MPVRDHDLLGGEARGLTAVADGGAPDEACARAATQLGGVQHVVEVGVPDEHVVGARNGALDRDRIGHQGPGESSPKRRAGHVGVDDDGSPGGLEREARRAERLQREGRVARRWARPAQGGVERAQHGAGEGFEHGGRIERPLRQCKWPGRLGTVDPNGHGHPHGDSLACELLRDRA